MILWVIQTFILGFPSLGLLRSSTSRPRVNSNNNNARNGNATSTPTTPLIANVNATSSDGNKKTH
jgi:hypothetical protein